jgi:hypothetical protein
MVTSELITTVLAETAVKIVANCFASVPDDARRCFRVKNLTPSVAAVKFLTSWKKQAPELGYQDVTVVVSGDTDLDVPSEYRADPDKSITHYRNNNSSGLIYVETKVESDEQGLKNLFTLKDGNFLDGSFDEAAFATKHEIIRKAWEALGKDAASFPKLLSERLAEVLGMLHPDHVSIPVRKFIYFAVSALEERANLDANLDPDQTAKLVGKNLVHLDLFPDQEWHLAGTESRISRRLQLNSFHADLSGSATNELDPDALSARCEKTVFRDLEGNEYGPDEQTHWKALCSRYCQTPKRDLRGEIPYRIFEQLFAPDAVGLKLGERVQSEIEASAVERLIEFDNLKIKDGLDRRVQEEAQRFLETEPVDELLEPLRRNLTPQTRRMVEKVAYPANEKFDNPLVKTAEIASVLLGRNSESGEDLTVELSLAKDDMGGTPSVGLFSFIFGRTLGAVVNSSKDSAGGARLRVAAELLKSHVPPALRALDDDDNAGNDDDDDGEADEGVVWAPVPVVFKLFTVDGKEIDSEAGLEWFPENIDHLATFWLLTADKDSPLYCGHLGAPASISFASWIDLASRRLTTLGSLRTTGFSETALVDPIFEEARQLGLSFLANSGTEGFSSELLLDHFDVWANVLERAKKEFVPDGKSDERLKAFLSLDSVDDGTENIIVLLPTHPLRLRWLGHYLRRSEELATKSLAGELPLNSQNEKLYLDWFSRLSPHKHPPIAIDFNNSLMSAARGSALYDYFSPLDVATGDGTLDTASLWEVSRQLTLYMDSHPHKRDGLSLLVLSPHMIGLPAELLASFRRGEWKDASITIHVVAPRKGWEVLTDRFENLTTESRMGVGQPLFPPIQLRLYEYSPGKSLQDLVGEEVFDVGIVPNFLHDKIDTQFNTDPPMDMGGHFDPLLDSPTHVYGGTDGGYISVAMRPRNPDEAMANWSTLCVRNHRGRPVSPTQTENQDFAELRIDFSEASRLFSQLHEKCHWVITVEEHITREQIELLEGGPDILSVKDRIGASGLYSLIVSSNSGRKFIVDRLNRKLTKFVPSRDLSMRRDGAVRQLAEHVYDEARSIAPRLALQAMGVSRVTEEILGLSIAKSVADHSYPTNPKEGFTGWVSLDDHLDWFNGPGATRADLCKFSFEVVDGKVFVDLLVVEGKLRQHFDPHGVSQVRSTVKLLEEAVKGNDNDGREAEDSKLWREEFLSAIENSSREARCVFGITDSDAMNPVPSSIRRAFRDGNFSLRSLSGLYSICIHDKRGAIAVELDDDVQIVHSYRNHILGLIEKKTVGLLPTPHVQVARNPDLDDCGNVEEEIEIDPEAGAIRDAGPLYDNHPGDPTNVEAPARSGLPPEALSNRYQQILDKYGQFNVSVRAPDNPGDRFVEGPASILFRIKPGDGTDPKKLFEKADSLKLELNLREEQNIRFGIDEGSVTIDVPKKEDERYFVDAEELWKGWSPPVNELSVPIGEDRVGKVVALNFSSSNTPHLLIGGTTGSGKSEALNTILYGLVRYYGEKELRLLLVDPKGTELQSFSDHPSLERDIGWDDQDAVEILVRCVDEMQARYSRFRGIKKRSLPEYNAVAEDGERLPWWVVVLDEYADLTSDPDSKKQIEDNLKRLAQKARAAGIHVIIATQNPKGDVISTNLRSNLPAQLALRVKSGTESRVIMDEAGAESLNGMGDAFLKSAKGLIRVQCAKVREVEQ